MFETAGPRKYLLRISNLGFMDAMIDEEYLENVLRKHIALPRGKLDHKCMIEQMIVLLWDFFRFTSCSDASKGNFKHVRCIERVFKFPNIPKATVSLPFFTIDDTEIFRDEENQIIKEEYVYPEVTEKTRENALQRALQAHKFNVNASESAKSTVHFCEFSGGGDLYITGNVSALVVVTPAEADSTAESDSSANESSVATNDVSLLGAQGRSMPSMIATNIAVNKEKSPTVAGQSKLVSLTLELKKNHFMMDKLKYQLWANMINLAVNNFVKSLENSSMTKKYLVDLKILTGYGIACTGDGIFGAFKVEMDLSSATSSTKFITKIPLGNRDRLKAAALMDFTLEYFKDRC